MSGNNFGMKAIIKQAYIVKLKPISGLHNVDIFCMPSKISNNDILAMFKGLLNLMREQLQQEQTAKYLAMKLKYNRLKYIHQKSKQLKRTAD